MLRERYLVSGPEGLGDTDLLVLLLGTGAAARSARTIATDLLDRFGGLPGLAEAPPRALAEVRGVGDARTVRLHAALALSRRANLPGPDRNPVKAPADAARWFVPALEGLVEEELHALYVDRRLRPLAYRRLNKGSALFTIMDPGQVLRPAVALGAHGLFLAHNHPSGDPEPSVEDVRSTQQIERAASLVGVKLLDHLVVARKEWSSLSARGELRP